MWRCRGKQCWIKLPWTFSRIFLWWYSRGSVSCFSNSFCIFLPWTWLLPGAAITTCAPSLAPQNLWPGSCQFQVLTPFFIHWKIKKDLGKTCDLMNLMLERGSFLSRSETFAAHPQVPKVGIRAGFMDFSLYLRSESSPVVASVYSVCSLCGKCSDYNPWAISDLEFWPKYRSIPIIKTSNAHHPKQNTISNPGGLMLRS